MWNAVPTLLRMLSPRLRYSLAVVALAVLSMVIAACVTDGPTFLSAQTAEPSVTELTDTAAATEVEIQRRFNELRSELLDDRSDTVEWWLTATAIFVTLFGVGAVLIGYLAYSRFGEIEREAKESAKKVQKAAEEATRDAQRVKEKRQQFEQEYASPASRPSFLSRVAEADQIEEIGKDVEAVQSNPLLDKVIADAYDLRQQGQVREAIEKVRAFASIMEGVDDHVAASAWFFVGYLSQEERRED